MSLIKNIRAARAAVSAKKLTAATTAVVGKGGDDDMTSLIDTLLFSMVHDHETMLGLLDAVLIDEEGENLRAEARKVILRQIGRLPRRLWAQIGLGAKAAAVRSIVQAIETAHLDVVDDLLVPASAAWGFESLLGDETAVVEAVAV